MALIASLVAATDLVHAGLLYLRFRNFTMIPFRGYIANIELVRRFARRVPGAVVECGTWKGGMAAGMVLATRHLRTYHFFDSFAGLPDAKPIDGEAALRWQSQVGSETYHQNCRAEFDEFVALMNATLGDTRRVSIHRGLFQHTVWEFAASKPRIAILRLDGDWYDSTMTCLQALYDEVEPGGLIILDDYHTWDGCARAVHDFLSSRALPSRIHQSLLGRFAYIVKRASDRTEP